MPIKECREKTGKAPIRTKWLGVNKGDDTCPNYRCRLVAQEVNRDNQCDLFAATPPIESLRQLLLLCASNEGGKPYKIRIIDVSRAYFYAPTTRPVYISLPPDDAESGMCGRLQYSMCGTRDATQKWERHWQHIMKQAGFKVGEASPCQLYNKEREIRMVVHGDDFTILGTQEDLDWITRILEKEYNIKHKTQGCLLCT